jgi:hypothetical protein
VHNARRVSKVRPSLSGLHLSWERVQVGRLSRRIAPSRKYLMYCRTPAVG